MKFDLLSIIKRIFIVTINTMTNKIFSSQTQKYLFSIQNAFITFINPEKGANLAAMSETMIGIDCVLNKLHKRMYESENGIQLMKHKPIVHESILGTEDVLKYYERGTLGREYYEFMRVRHDFKASERSPILYIEDPELGYILLRYRQTHDFYHVLAGLETSVLEEIALKWFEASHFNGLPSATLSSLVGPLRIPFEEQKLLVQYYIPWALRNASQCEFLLSVPFENILEEPIDQVRKRLKIQPAPKIIRDTL